MICLGTALSVISSLFFKSIHLYLLPAVVSLHPGNIFEGSYRPEVVFDYEKMCSKLLSSRVQLLVANWGGCKQSCQGVGDAGPQAEVGLDQHQKPSTLKKNHMKTAITA